MNSKKNNIFKKIALLACMGIFLTACSSVREGASNFASRTDFDLGSTPVYYSDAKVLRGPVQVHVHPIGNLDYTPTALFVPLGIVQDMRDEKAISLGVSRIMWEAFLTEQTFPTLELADIVPPYKLEYVLSLAKAKGAETMLGGYITYFFDGGPTGISKLAVKLDLYHVESGQLLWSLSHSATLAYEKQKDFILFENKQRMPTDPMSVLVYTVASDLAKIIYTWTHGGYPSSP